MTSILGWLGSVCLALCAAPQAYKCYKEKSSDGTSLGLLILWTIGEIATLIYILPKADIPLIMNYTANLFFLAVIWRYKKW